MEPTSTPLFSGFSLILGAQGLNAVAPGTIRTAMTKSYYGDSDFLHQADADSVAHLASPRARHVTGTALHIDRGGPAQKKCAPLGSGKSHGARRTTAR